MCIPDSGLLLVDKPQGVTSHDVVACARHLLHTKRVGHAGTLDPMATGLLIIGFGYATRLMNYMLGHDKTYEAVIRLGEATTTDDAEGEVLSESVIELGPGVKINSKDKLLSEIFETDFSENNLQNSNTKTELLNKTFQRIKQVIKENLTGKIMQAPTAFSAIKINGQRAYDLAREGKTVELESREINVYSFDISNPLISTGVSGRKVLDVTATVSCSSGTYIRALARDLGRLLGVGGHLVKLRRTSIGDFSVKSTQVLRLNSETREFTDRNGIVQKRSKAVPPSNFDTKKDLPKSLLTMMQAAEHTLPTFLVDKNQAQDLRFGRWICLNSTDSFNNLDSYPAIAYSYDELTGEYDVVSVVEQVKNKNCEQIKPIVVFPADEKPGKIKKSSILQ